VMMLLAPLIALSTPKDYHDNGPACQVRNGHGVGDGGGAGGGPNSRAVFLQNRACLSTGGQKHQPGCCRRRAATCVSWPGLRAGLPLQLIVFARGCTRGCGGRCGAGTRAIGTSPSRSKWATTRSRPRPYARRRPAPFSLARALHCCRAATRARGRRGQGAA
jgi:hypothetical protein